MTNEKDLWDTCVVGAGAAGLMTAITAARSGLSVLLIDRRDRYGAKIIMSGGTRCNLTNEQVLETDFATSQPRIVKAVLQNFDSAAAIHFFNGIGIETVREAGGKIFPSTHSGQSVLEALQKEAVRSGVKIKTPLCAESASKEKEHFLISGPGFLFHARSLVLTTGGLSYPSTGSTGIGYSLAEGFAHTLVQTSPSLTPLLSSDALLKKLSGLTLRAALDLFEENKKTKSFTGSFLFTHLGFSGPAALNMSRYWIRSTAKDRAIFANFLPKTSIENMRARFIRDASGAKGSLKNYLAGILPERLSRTLMEKAGINDETPLSSLKKEKREELLNFIFRCPLSVHGDRGYAVAEVTAGGVSLKEINRRDMQSRLTPGLFLAGEILDVDGRIGGFNFQWAWASGATAGRGVKHYLSASSGG